MLPFKELESRAFHPNEWKIETARVTLYKPAVTPHAFWYNNNYGGGPLNI